MRQLHCPECKSNKASLSGRCETCGREMVPMLGVDVIEPLKAPITDVIPTQELLSKFHDRVFATRGIRRVLERIDNYDVPIRVQDVEHKLSELGWQSTEGTYTIDNDQHVMSDIWFHPSLSMPGEYGERPNTYIELWETVTANLEQTGRVGSIELHIGDQEFKVLPADIGRWVEWAEWYSNVLKQAEEPNIDDIPDPDEVDND